MIALRATPALAALLQTLLARADPAARVVFDPAQGAVVVDSGLDRGALIDFAAALGLPVDEAGGDAPFRRDADADALAG